MKNIITLIFSAFIALSATAQQNISLQIEHFLGTSPFALNTAATNNFGNDFNVKRLEYYISQVTLIHDGGQETTVANTWILANATTTTTANLGAHSITTLEAVKMSIGVEPAANHLDPASYPSSHPLAPKSPSMHWGWAPGYRFVAMEGKSGANLNLTFEIHALGDANYFTFTIPTSGTVSGNDLLIELKANYEMALKDITMTSGPVLHGETGIAHDLLVNFNRYVFTSASGAQSMNIDENRAVKISVGPNPSTKVVTISAEGLNQKNLEVIATDLTGKIVAHTTLNNNGSTQLSFAHAGMYFVSVLQNGESFATEKVIITK